MLGDRFPDLDVSRETMEKLALFAQLVQKWTPKINLIAKSSIADIWQRHILDSAQIATLSDRPQKWLDLGSGGGFPGLVVAILFSDQPHQQQMTLVDSDARKCAFLRTAARELELDVTVINSRINTLAPQAAETLSARALAPLKDLLIYADLHLGESGLALLQKGVSWREEVEHAQRKWSFCLDVIESSTNDSATILKVSDIKRKS